MTAIHYLMDPHKPRGFSVTAYKVSQNPVSNHDTRSIQQPKTRNFNFSSSKYGLNYNSFVRTHARTRTHSLFILENVQITSTFTTLIRIH